MTISSEPRPTRHAGDRAAYRSLVERLNRQSVERHADAYVDVPWDDPAMNLDVGDERLELWSVDPLATTAWYRNQPPRIRAEIGLFRTAAWMRTGVEFENLLQRGLLTRAFWLPNDSTDFRYLHHEVVEESQHSLMFQEFVNRSGLDPRGLPRPIKLVAGSVVRLSRWNPALFFLFVLGGEEPIDRLQRQYLKGPGHPLVQHIMRIHVSEEARHISYARQYLRYQVPRLPAARRRQLAVTAPILLGLMARLMLQPTAQLVARYGIPTDQRQAAWRTPEARALLADSVARTRRLCDELGLITPRTRPLWDRFGVGHPDPEAS